MRRIGTIAVFMAVALLAGACGNAAKEAAEQAAGVDVEVDDDSTTVTQDDGTTTMIEAELPDGWPAEFPLPEGARATEAATTETGEYTTYSVLFASDASYEDLKAFFDEALASNGWTIATAFDSPGEADDGGDFRSYSVTGPGWQGSVSIGAQASAAGAEGNIYVALITTQD